MYELRVLSGLHRGAVLPLIGQNWIIGSGNAADLTLCDHGIKVQHCQLTKTENAWSLSSMDGLLVNNEGYEVELIAHLEADTAFALNGVWLQIAEPSSPWQDFEQPQVIKKQAQSANDRLANGNRSADRNTTLSRTATKPYFGIFMAAAIAATGAWAALEPGRGQQQIEPQENINESIARFNDPVTIDAPQMESAQQVKLKVLAMLEEREIRGDIEVTVAEDIVFIQGQLPQETLGLVERMLQRFDNRYDTAVPIENLLKPIASTLPFKIAQVIHGKLDHVVTQEGKRLFIGDDYKGFKLVSIAPHKIIFKGSQQYEVKW